MNSIRHRFSIEWWENIYIVLFRVSSEITTSNVMETTIRMLCFIVEKRFQSGVNPYLINAVIKKANPRLVGMDVYLVKCSGIVL